MNRILQIGSILLLVVGASYAGKQKTPQDSPPPSKPAPARPAPAKGGAPRAGGIPAGGARLVNPASIASHLFRMSPEEREHALEKLPNEQQRENARKLLAWFDSLPKETQALQLRRLDNVAKLTPEQRAEASRLLVEANHLPPPRAAAVRQALYRLQQMTDQERENTLRRPAFQARFSPEELRIITGLSDAWMGPVQ
jgi:hypothetical protein